MSIDIDFLNVFYGPDDATNFTAQLFRLIAKADLENQEKFHAGFPDEVDLYLWWMGQNPIPKKQDVVDYVNQKLNRRRYRPSSHFRYQP